MLNIEDAPGYLQEAKIEAQLVTAHHCFEITSDMNVDDNRWEAYL